ncbi:MAG TPA: GNAT family N-acetyltransferase [Candidatus Binatia bacterium]|nr:GNAT family N-acetyltransferase [Candidatus Binatia bacterium]
MPPAPPPVIRPVRDDELVAWFSAFSTAFYIWASDPQASAAARREHLDLQRTIGAFEGDTIVGTFRSFPTKLTLPGNARLDVGAVSAVSVRPTHRRRGTLSRMIAYDVDRAVAAGEAASILIASEWPIYGRFGFGPATWQATWTLRTKIARFLVEPVGSLEIVDVPTARELVPGIYDRAAARRPGEIARPDHRWDFDLGVREIPGRPRWRGSIVIHRDADGRPDGFARFHGEEKWSEMLPDHVLALDELHAATLEAEIDLWRHLAQMDLTTTIKAETRRTEEPFPWFLADARLAQPGGVSDFLWVRILDVPKVLGSRAYERDGELVLEVTDTVDGRPGPAAGRYRLFANGGAASCERTDASPDLTIDVRALSAASLGGTRLSNATRTSPMTAAPPWCATFF